MSTIFNADILLNAAIDAKLSTSIPPLPEQEMIFTIEKVDFKNPKDAMVVFELQCSTMDDAAKEATGMEKPMCKYSGFLDLTPTGMIDTAEGKNTALGRIREAIGQNEAGIPWTPGMMLGQQFRGLPKQKPDSKDPTIIRSEISRVAAI